MKNTKLYLLIVVLLLGAMALVACGGGETETTEQPVATEAAAEPTEEMVAEPTEEMAAEPTEEMAAEPTEEVAAEPTEEMAAEMTLASDTTKTMTELLAGIRIVSFSGDVVVTEPAHALRSVGMVAVGAAGYAAIVTAGRVAPAGMPFATVMVTSSAPVFLMRT